MLIGAGLTWALLTGAVLTDALVFAAVKPGVITPSLLAGPIVSRALAMGIAQRGVVVGVGINLVGLRVPRVALAAGVLGLCRCLLGGGLLSPRSGGRLVGLGLRPVGLVSVHLGLLADLTRLVPVLLPLLLALLPSGDHDQSDHGDHHQHHYDDQDNLHCRFLPSLASPHMNTRRTG